MANTRAERLARRIASRANTEPFVNSRGHPCTDGAPERNGDPEPRIEDPEDHDGDRSEDDLSNEEAPSLHPCRAAAS